MKRASRFLFVSILVLCVMSSGVSASGMPTGTLLPDNVTGFGTTVTAPSADGILPGTGATGDPVTVGTGISSPDGTGSQTGGPSQSKPADPSKTSKTLNEASGGAENYALASNGAKYSIVRLSSDKKTEEQISEYFGGTDDAGNKRLNDNVYGDVESASKSVAVGGSGRTFRFKFDLGTKRNGINRIVFKNIQDSYSSDPLNNRSFDETKFRISSGDSESGMKDVAFTIEKKQLGENGFSFDVTLNIANGASGRYFCIEAGPVENAFVLSTDEIQIFGERTVPSDTTETEIKTPATGDGKGTGYALVAIVSSMLIAAIVLYRRKKTV